MSTPSERIQHHPLHAQETRRDHIQAGRFGKSRERSRVLWKPPSFLSLLKQSSPSPLPQGRASPPQAREPAGPTKGLQSHLLQYYQAISHGGIERAEEHHGVLQGARALREAEQQGPEQHQWRGPGLSVEPDLAAGPQEQPQVQPAAGRPRPRRRPHRRRRLPALRRRQVLVPRLHQAVPRAGGPAQAAPCRGGRVREGCRRRAGRRGRERARRRRGVHLRHRARGESEDDAHRRRRDGGGARWWLSCWRVRRREGGVHRRALRLPAVAGGDCLAGWCRVGTMPLLHEAAAGEHGHLHL